MPPDLSTRRKAADAISKGESLDWSRLNEDGELSEGEVKAFQFLELMQQIQKKDLRPDGADRSPNPVRLDTGFEIIEELGQGAYSKVYRAQDKALDREVALKELKCDLPMTNHQLERFIREARVLAALDHPNIVRIHSIDQKEGRVRLCLERIQGCTLTKLIEEEKPLSPERAARIGLELSRALRVLHGRGLIHRDLKPSNVMYTPKDRAVLLDFGLAHSLGPGDVMRSRGMTGTPLFMAPEQFVPGSAIDESVDIYALGVMLYWMTSGDFPFEGEDFYALRDRVLKGQCVPLEERTPGIPAAFVNIVSKAMAVRPKDRFKSAEEMEKSLAKFLGQSPSDAARTAERAAPDSSRRKLWAAAFLLILSALAVVLISIGFFGTGGNVQPSLKMDRDVIRSIIASKPGRERIIFSMAGENEEYDIYMLNPNDSSLINLTSEIQGYAYYPRISPSGSRIAFRVYTPVKSEIWCMDADGKLTWRVSPFDRLDNPQKLEWYDEETLWITADSKDGDSALFSMRIDASRADVVVDSVSPENHRPFGFKISPDGKYLVICASITTKSPDIQVGANLYLADVIDDYRIGNIRPFFLDDDSRRNWTPLWSKDSSKIYWIRNGGQDEGRIAPSLVWKHVRSPKSIDEYDAAISFPEVRTAGNHALSMDGSQILISMDGRLSMFDPTTGEGAQVFAGMSDDFFKGVDWGCLRNEKIVLSTTPGRGKDSTSEHDIFSVNPYCTKPENLTCDFHEGAVHPKLSPDGKRIAFCSSSEGGKHVWVMNCDGSAKRRLTRNARSEFCYIQEWWDDESLIFCGKDENLEHEYMIVNLRGEEMPWPYFQPHRDIQRLALRRSPTGKEMAVIVARGERPSQKIEIYIQNLQSREMTLFFRGETGYPGIFPLWSPDGNILCWSYGLLTVENDPALDPRLDVVYKYRNSRKGIDEFDGIIHPNSEGGVWPCEFSPWGGKILLRNTVSPRGIKLFVQDLKTQEREVLFKTGQIVGDCDWGFFDYGNCD